MATGLARDSRLSYSESSDHELGRSSSELARVTASHEHSTRTNDETQSVRTKLYVSHAVAAWNSRTFEFGAVLYLAAMYPASLLPASTYAMSRSLAAVLFSSTAGDIVDRWKRIRVVRMSIVGQRCAVLLSCMFFLLLLVHDVRASPFSWLVIAALSLLAGIEKLSAIANSISIERDWVIVISGGSTLALQSINSSLRRIDLTCKLVAPLIIASVHSLSPKAAILFTLILAMISLPAEYVLIAKVCASYPDLLSPRPQREGSTMKRACPGCLERIVTGGYKNLVYYTTHPAFLPSISLSMLYLTVLSFAGQMISYLVTKGLPSWSIGVLRTTAAIFEISATWLAPLLMERIGAVRSGIWLLNWQLGCLIIATSAMWSNGSTSAILSLFLPGVIASRAGLWGFDLSAQYLIQEDVEADARGRFSSIEAAWQNFFELLAFASTAVFSDPSDFKIPCTISAGATGLASVLYAVHVRRRRGHLFHASKCLDRKQTRSGSYQQIPLEETEAQGSDSRLLQQ